MKGNEIVCGLDIGTTKVCAVIGERKNTGIEVLGFGIAPSEGLHRGLVSHIAKTAEAIKKAMEIATNRAGVEIKHVNVGVAGEHIKSLRHRNFITINNAEREITQADLERLIADVKTIRIPSDQEILHIIPEDFSIDHQSGIENPVGMSGTRLEALNHVVFASTPALQNIRKSVERAGFQIGNYILQPLASSYAVLDENEMDLGVVLLDIGGGTTDIALFKNKSVKYTKVIGIAGNQVTNDIKESLGVVLLEAEKLKRFHGYATESEILKDEQILIKSVGARGNSTISSTILTQIISLRMRELFTIIDENLRQTELKSKIISGLVLTGGGALLRGCKDLAEEVFGIPARLGVPTEFLGGLSEEIESPVFATVAGLVKGIPSQNNQFETYKEEIEKEEIVKINIEDTPNEEVKDLDNKEESEGFTGKIKKITGKVIKFFDDL